MANTDHDLHDPSTMTRTLGRSGIEVSALGLGCWAIGGVWNFQGTPGGWSQVDDDESIRAVRRATELGVTFFDTAANYGAGHSETVLGRALAPMRDDVVLATKFGYRVDETDRSVDSYPGQDTDGDIVAHLKDDVRASLRRLATDRVDVYQLHVGDLRLDRALEVRDALEDLVAQGLIRTYGWSTDNVAAVREFSTRPGCSVVQHGLSVLGLEDPAMLDLCEQANLASINRSPLGMGLLSGKFNASTRFGADDQRHVAGWHPGFAGGAPTPEWLRRLDSVRDVLTSGGRTLAQGALAWIWGRSERTIPIPGFKTVAQVEENCGALKFGPLDAAQMSDIETILD